MRMTGQRKAILETLEGDTSHPTADQVYHRVKEALPHISLGTVYRNLKLLSEAGHILEIEIADGPNRYDPRTEHHYHFQCEGCGQMLDVDLPFQQCLHDALARAGFQVRGHDIQFSGLCPPCAGAGAN